MYYEIKIFHGKQELASRKFYALNLHLAYAQGIVWANDEFFEGSGKEYISTYDGISIVNLDS